MSLQTFFDNFALLADAPNGVAKLRELILQLAVQGRLVTQHANEPEGKGLLKGLLRAEGKGKLSSFDDTDVDIESWVIPKSWAFTHLESASYGKGIFADGDWVETKDQDPSGDIRLIQLADVGDGKYRDRSSRFMNEETAIRLNCTFLEPNDVLIARMPDPIGRACLFPGDAKKSVTVVDVCVLRANTDYFVPDFLVIAINSPSFRNLIKSKITGTTRSRISRGNLSRLRIPLLAIEEQKRIVAKVGELMRLCDELEARQQSRRGSRMRLNDVTLAPLNNAASLVPEEFGPVVVRLADNFATLYDSAETVGKLRSTILQLAVQGKLVLQDPKSEPASDLLRKIRSDREATAKAKKKKVKQLALSDSLVSSASLPFNWHLEVLGNLVEPERSISYGVLVPGHDLSEGIPFVRLKDLSVCNPPAKPAKTIDPEIEKQYARTRLKGGEILLGVVGSIGKLGVAPASWAGANIARAVGRIAPHYLISRDYLTIALQSPGIQTYFLEATRTLAQPTLNVSLIELTPIPVPPLEEQKRIVAKVNQLMTLCDELETKLRRAEADSEKLMSAAVRHVLTSLPSNEGLAEAS